MLRKGFKGQRRAKQQFSPAGDDDDEAGNSQKKIPGEIFGKF